MERKEIGGLKGKAWKGRGRHGEEMKVRHGLERKGK